METLPLCPPMAPGVTPGRSEIAALTVYFPSLSGAFHMMEAQLGPLAAGCTWPPEAFQATLTEPWAGSAAVTWADLRRTTPTTSQISGLLPSPRSSRMAIPVDAVVQHHAQLVGQAGGALQPDRAHHRCHRGRPAWWPWPGCPRRRLGQVRQAHAHRLVGQRRLGRIAIHLELRGSLHDVARRLCPAITSSAATRL